MPLNLNQSNHKFINLVRTSKELPTKTLTRANNCRVYKIPYTNKLRDRVILLVKCQESYSNPKGHLVYLRLQPMKLRNINTKTKSVLNIPMKIFCKCPAFLYYGSKYHATQEKYLITKFKEENRPPLIKDPLNQNKLCKHLASVKNHLGKQSIYKAMQGNRAKSLKNNKQSSKQAQEELLDLSHTDINIHNCLIKDTPTVTLENLTLVVNSYIKTPLEETLTLENFYDTCQKHGLIPLD